MYKKRLLCFLILFSVIIIVNEYTRLFLPIHSSTYHTIKTIHSSKNNNNQCTWVCHHQTNYCKNHHVKLIQNFEQTDKMYLGLIKLLQSSKHYALANLLILGLLIPVLITYFLFKSMKLQQKINDSF